MQSNFAASLALVLNSEGGFVNNPKDPGGATNRGITQATYDAYRAAHGLARAGVKFISMADVTAIYQFQYWNQVRGDTLPVGVDYILFDEAVNSGPVQAAKDLQRALGFKGRDVDGHIGLMTLTAVAKVRDIESLIDRICDLRLNYLHIIRSGKLWKIFGKGWSNRVATARSAAKKMRRTAANDNHAAVAAAA